MKALGISFVDDAFITARHLKNFADGYWFVYNKGDMVEGLSNVGYALFLYPIYSFTNYTFASFIVNSLAFIASYVVAFTVLRSFRVNFVNSLCGVITPALFFFNVHWVRAGLEGPFNALFLILLIFLFTIERNRLLIAAALIFVFIRPENFIFVFALSGFLIGRKSYKTAVFVMLISFIPMIYRYTVYGYPFPNTVYAKSILEFDMILRPFEFIDTYILNMVTSYWMSDFLISGLGIVIPLSLILSFARFPKSIYLQFSSVMFVLISALFFSSQGDWMGKGRFFVEMWPLFAISLGLLLKPLKAYYSVFFLFTAFLLSLSMSWGSFFHASQRDGLAELRFAERASPFALFLNEILDEQDVVATDIAGFEPYHLRTNVMDMFGLANEEIAHQGKTKHLNNMSVPGKIDYNFVFKNKPSAFLVNHSCYGSFIAKELVSRGLEERYLYMQRKASPEKGRILFLRSDKLASSPEFRPVRIGAAAEALNVACQARRLRT